MKQSAQDNVHPYLKVAFWFKPENQFWNKPSEVLVDNNGHIDRFLSTTEKGRDYFMNMISDMDKRSAKKTHLL